jgi:hypothetical protein
MMTQAQIPALIVCLALFATPVSVLAQCGTPEACKEEEGYEICVEPEQAADTVCAYEDCYVSQGFCQLKDKCDPECVDGGGVHEELLAFSDFSPDLGITPAGTYLIPPGRRIPGVRGHAFRTCRGRVASYTQEPSQRPRTITLQ